VGGVTRTGDALDPEDCQAIPVDGAGLVAGVEVAEVAVQLGEGA
jgi:hypothetical protein